ncbi:MAG TPA: CmpA/NrtA family ABC transporter substrate-binding protein [Candidatus Didemnitutus sp.]|nr:CmpA/NrtA family ABC transporter substrate-binding protein [Candidatus Didemnitutus sp.]
MARSSSSSNPKHRKRRLRVGFLALTDAAPLVAARELGLFERHHLQVDLCREVGWATVRDKIVYGELDAAQALAPLLWAARLGIGGPPCDVLTALVLNRHGNAVTIASRLLIAGVRDAAGFRAEARRRHGENRLTLGIVHPFSSHHLLLRQWLRQAGLDPDRDVRIVVVPPPQMFRNLAAGTLDGYCVGEPWGTVAVQAGQGWCPASSAELAPGHVEKVLMVRAEFAQRSPDEHCALVAALAEAGRWCDEARHRGQLARWLAEPRYLDLPVETIEVALSGHFDNGVGRLENLVDFFIFSRGQANVPAVSHAEAMQADLIAAGLVESRQCPPGLPGQLFREDLFRLAVPDAQLLQA